MMCRADILTEESDRYRLGDSVALSALNYRHESTKFEQANGDRLSDHNPILVQFAWSTD
jgi:hypothetical protein